jgi:hypothetical protein
LQKKGVSVELRQTVRKGRTQNRESTAISF